MFGSPDRYSAAAALLIVAFVVGIGIRYNIFVPWGTDSAAYLTAAHDWAEGELFRPASFTFWAEWDRDGYHETPLGNRPGLTKGSMTGVYPLGYPILLAVALKIGGDLAMYTVAPMFAGLLAWCSFLLAAELSTGWAGVVAAFLISATPITLWHAMNPMSDVPAAALWALAWVMALRPGFGAALAAGAATALAVMVRPNLAPIAVAIAAVVVASHGSGWHRLGRLFVYGALASVGPVLVFWSQAVLYGHPLTFGYPASPGFFFNAERIPRNARLYPATLNELHTWWAFTGFALVPISLLMARRHREHVRAALIATSAAGIIAINYALYLPYLTYEGWHWLRFLLPALAAVFILFAGAVDRVRLLLAQRFRPLGVLAVIPVVIVSLHPADKMREQVPPAQYSIYPRLQMMGHYLRAVLPSNAVIVTFLQGGSAALYTGLPIVRFDLIPRDSLDTVISDLKRHGHRPVLMLDHAVDHLQFRERFPSSKYVRLDWPARAEFFSSTVVSYRDPDDREEFLSGDRRPVDLLLWPPASPFRGTWSLLSVPREAIVFPPVQDSWRFKQALERKYETGLRRAAAQSAVDPKTSIVWTRRYLRYRLHGCAHGPSVSRVFAQIDGGGAQPLCLRPEGPVFPPRDDTIDFRRQLEEKYRGIKPAAPPAVTFVDLVGDAVWNQEYLQYRVAKCSHEQAMQAVFDQIEGRGATATCSN